MSIARLYQSQDKNEEAICVLSGVYEGFTEGFETGDLRTARSMLEQLSIATSTYWRREVMDSREHAVFKTT